MCECANLYYFYFFLRKLYVLFSGLYYGCFISNWRRSKNHHCAWSDSTEWRPWRINKAVKKASAF